MQRQVLGCQRGRRRPGRTNAPDPDLSAVVTSGPIACKCSPKRSPGVEIDVRMALEAAQRDIAAQPVGDCCGYLDAATACSPLERMRKPQYAVQRIDNGGSRNPRVHGEGG